MTVFLFTIFKILSRCSAKSDNYFAPETYTKLSCSLNIVCIPDLMYTMYSTVHVVSKAMKWYKHNITQIVLALFSDMVKAIIKY